MATREPRWPTPHSPRAASLHLPSSPHPAGPLSGRSAETGEANTPSKGTRIGGVIVTGLDSKDKTFAVRIDAQKGKLDDADLKKIIDSVEVR